MIAEAAAHISEPLRGRHPAVPWAQIAGFRNILIHAYFGIDWEIVWIASTKETPALLEQISGVLRAEYPSATSTE